MCSSWRISWNSSNDYYGMYNELLYNDAFICNVYGMPLDAIIQMGTVINSKVTDLYTFVIWMIAPFNIIKAGLMTVVTLPLFKKMEKILTK